MAKFTKEQVAEIVARKVYENSRYQADGISFETFRKFNCSDCSREGCVHRECYRRLPEVVGGLGLCPNLD